MSGPAGRGRATISNHRFADVRDAAVAIIRGNVDLAERLDALAFMDLRRTCIVTLGLND